MQELELISKDLKEIKSIILSRAQSKELSFNADIQEYLNTPSKLLRPAICILFSKAYYNKIEQNIYLAAAAIELAHNSSLLHDDVIDDAETRRSQISFNKKTTSKIAILAGDWLLAQTIELLNQIGSINLYKEFSQGFSNMALGELSELYSRFEILPIDKYFQKNDQKTGELFKLAAASPFIIYEDKPIIEKAKNFGRHFANAFQIKDDITNYFGLQDNKPTKTDCEQGIYTLPEIIKANNSSANLYEESCQILKHQVNLSLESLDFLGKSEYKEAIISLCRNLLKGI